MAPKLCDNPTVDRPSQPMAIPSTAARHLLFGLTGLVLVLRHLHVYYTEATISHLGMLGRTLGQLRAGNPWVLGEELGNTGLFLGGPLYAWINAPALLWANPVTGVHVTYFALELACIAAWFYWPTGAGLPRGERWLGALALALFIEPKLELVQNDTIMGLLAIPLFIIFVRALRRGAWRGMFVAGAVAGMAVSVHQVAVLLLPALLVSLLVQRELMVRRALAGLAGMAVVLALLSLPSLWAAQEMPASHQEVVSWGINLRHMLVRLVIIVGQPLATLGLLLAVAAWVAGKGLAPGHRVAVAWLLLGGVLLALAYAMRAEMSGQDFVLWKWSDARYAALNPAKAALAAHAVFRVGRAVGPRLGRLVPRGATAAGAIMLAAACAALLLVGANHRARTASRRGHLLASRGSCSVELFMQSFHSSRHFHPLFASLLRDPLTLATHPEGKEHMPLQRDLFILSLWNRGPLAEPPTHRPNQPRNLLLPRFPRVNLTRLAGAHVHGPGVLLPDVPAARLVRALRPGGGERVLVDLAHARRSGQRWLLLYLPDQTLPGKLMVQTPAETLALGATDRCLFPAHGRSGHATYDLYDLELLPGEVRMLWVAPPPDGPISPDLAALLLPGNRRSDKP